MPKLFRTKKAYMHTIEAAIAVSISLVFVLFVISNNQPSEDVKDTLNLFPILNQNHAFRDCVIRENYSCLNSSISTHYPDFVKIYTYKINVTTDPYIIPLDLPQKEVFLESLLIAGNNTYTELKIMRVYYWLK